MISKNKYKIQSKKRYKKVTLVTILVAACLLGIVAILEVTGTTSLLNRHKDSYKTPRTANSETKGEAPAHSDSGDTTNPQPDNGQSNNSASPDKSPGSGSDNSAKPLAPTGNFVSNHRPNLSGSPAPNSIQSSCVTTPGASCQIIFTKGSETKSLPIQKTDLGGGAYWTWNLQDVGLTEGAWKVQAKATIGAETATADDALALEVRK